MSNYFEDLVQNIYTNCDMKGFDDLKRGYREAESLSRSLTRQEFQAQKQRLSLVEAEEKMQVRLGNYKQIQSVKTQNALDKENKKLADRNNILRGAFRFIAAYFSLKTLKNILDTGSRLQLIQKSIQGLTKDTQDWDFIQKQAFKTGTDIEVVAKGYRNFFSSARMAGFDKEGIQSMYADVLLSTRAIGATTQQTEGALLALEQMISKGTVSMEELRRQLGNALPGAFEIGAKAMNMTTTEFNKFVRTGKLASAEFVPKFIAQLKKEYASGFKEISETVDFASTNLRNAWKKLTIEIVSGKTGKEIAKLLNSITKTISSPTFLNAIRVTTTLLAKIVGFVGLLVNNLEKLMPFLLPAFLIAGSMGIMKVASALVEVIKAVAGINIAMGSLNIGVVALYGNLLGAISLFLVLEDILKGGQFRRIFRSWQDTKEMKKNLKNESVKNFAQKNGEVTFMDDGKMYRMPYSGNFENDYGGWKWNSDVMRSYRKMWIDKGQAKQIIPYKKPDGAGGILELNQDKSLSVNIGDINVTAPNGDAQTIATTVQNTLISLFMGQNLNVAPNSTITT